MDIQLRQLNTEQLGDMLENLKSDLSILQVRAGAMPQPLIPEYQRAILEVEKELRSRSPEPARKPVVSPNPRPSWEVIMSRIRHTQSNGAR